MNVSLEAGIGWIGWPTFLCRSIMRLREVLLSYLSILLLCPSPASIWYSSHSVYCLSLIFWHLRQSYLLSSTSCQRINLVRFAGGLDGITISSIVDCSPWEFSGSHRLISWTEFRAWLVDWNFLVVEESFFFFVCYFVWSILRSASPMSFLCPFFISWLEAEASNVEDFFFNILPTLHLAALLSPRSWMCYSRVSEQEYLSRFSCVPFTIPFNAYKNDEADTDWSAVAFFFSFLVLGWIFLSLVLFKMAQDELFGLTILV